MKRLRASLGSFCSTIELRPHITGLPRSGARGQRRSDSDGVGHDATGAEMYGPYCDAFDFSSVVGNV